MKLPVQAPAVVRGSVSWPTRRPAGGSTEPAIEPAAGAVVRCTDPNYSYACICTNGIATCCSSNAGCTVDPGTGFCNCSGEIP
jgi:hypothetical protein